MSCVRYALPGLGFRAEGATVLIRSSCRGLNLRTAPVYSSKKASAFSRRLSTTSTMPFQLSSIESTSETWGGTTSVPEVVDLVSLPTNERRREHCVSSKGVMSALRVRWKARSSLEICPAVRVVSTRADETPSLSALNEASESMTASLDDNHEASEANECKRNHIQIGKLIGEVRTIPLW